MIDIEAIFAEPDLKPKITTLIFTKPTVVKPTVYTLVTQAPTMPVESQVVGDNRPTNASLGVATDTCEAVRNAGPQPCDECGSALFWILADGSAVCCCKSKPNDSVSKGIIIILPDGGTAWERFEREAVKYVN